MSRSIHSHCSSIYEFGVVQSRMIDRVNGLQYLFSQTDVSNIYDKMPPAYSQLWPRLLRPSAELRYAPCLAVASFSCARATKNCTPIATPSMTMFLPSAIPTALLTDSYMPVIPAQPKHMQSALCRTCSEG